MRCFLENSETSQNGEKLKVSLFHEKLVQQAIEQTTHQEI